jgi:hypothetical protein
VGSARLSRRQIDALLAHAPRLKALRGAFVSGPAPAFVSPPYAPEVAAFFSAIQDEGFCDPNYSPAAAAEMMAGRERIARADIDDLRSMLTWCLRSERFSEGAWHALLRDGKVFALLDRLRELRDTAEP